MKNALLSLATVATIGLVSGSASASAVFQVQEGSIAGTPTDAISLFTADSFTSAYKEKIQITGANTFSSTAFFNSISFQNTNVGPANVSNYLGINESLFGGVGYKLYGTFTSSGTFVTDASGKTTFTGTTGTIELWADAKQDTTVGYGASGINVNIGGGTSDDVLLASSKILTSGIGQMQPSDQAGGFALNFGDLQLTAAGLTYFVEPDPFFVNVRATGQFDKFAVPGLNGIVDVTGGSLNAAFNNVPEPSSLALLGLGFAGLGLTHRRNKANKAK